MKRLLTAAAFLLALLVGCSHDVTPESTATVILPDGQTVVVSERCITPSETTYTGQGISYTRTVDAIRIVSPLGVSPGETISRQEPAKIAIGETPSINIGPDGVGVSKGGKTAVETGSGHWGLFDTIWQRLKDWFWILGMAALLLWLLPLFIPAAGPIVTKVFAAIGSFFAWLLPVIGRLFERHQTASNTAKGDNAFTAAIKASEELTDSQKDEVIDTFNKSYPQA